MIVSDYVVDFLAEHAVDAVFVLSGGGTMYLLDSLGQSDRLGYFCNRHEQACAIAAEGYARVTNRPGVCLVTTGPGAVNAASGILGAWMDSLPVLVISGQVRRDLIADFGCLRQKGPQEGDTIAMVTPITKYATSVTDASAIRVELERAWHAATSGRPGPAWVEIPLDVQAETVDVAALQSFHPPAQDAACASAAMSRGVARAAQALRDAQRPLLLCGSGIRLGNAMDEIRGLLDSFAIPAIVPDSAKDLLPETHPMNMGVFGPAAQRRANFAAQNCDCLLVLAASLCAKKIGFGYADFARRAVKIAVDIDEDQLMHQVIRPDIGVCGDVRVFLRLLAEELRRSPPKPRERWLDACTEWRRRYPLVTSRRHSDDGPVDCYAFMDSLASCLTNSDILVTGNGLDSVSYVQAFRVKEGQRTLLNANWGAMGWDLPLAVGACIGSGRRRTVCVTGDGSIQLNSQELMTISHYSLPIKVFVFNNSGYATIRATQRNLFEGRLVASGPATGVDNPDFRLLAAASGLGYSTITKNSQLKESLAHVLSQPGPALCEVMISPDQEIEPKTSAFRRDDGTLESRPLEDMAPFLPRDEVWRNMHLFDDEATSGAE